MRVLELYVDGSYKNTEPNVTKGAAIVLEDNKPLTCQRFITGKKEFVSMWNVGGELFATIGGLSLVKKVVDAKEKVLIKIYYDYTGINYFITGEWQAKKLGAQVYVMSVRQLQKSIPNIKFEFHKVKAHTGVKWNELADSIANGEIPSECILYMSPEYNDI